MQEKTPDDIREDAEMLLKKMGAKMSRLRKERGYTNHESFAYESGINRSQYGKYEAGSVDLRFSTLVKTINLLGLTLEDFFKKGLDPGSQPEKS